MAGSDLGNKTKDSQPGGNSAVKKSRGVLGHGPRCYNALPSAALQKCPDPLWSLLFRSTEKTEQHLSSETGNKGISSPLSTQLLIQAETAEGLKSEIYEKLQM